MKSKEAFFKYSFEKLKKIINEIPNEEAKNIYALSFYFYAEDDDLRFPTIEISYNTNEQIENETKNASSRIEAKWNYAFWSQNEIGKIGGEEDELLKKWFKETPYYFSDEENEKADEDEDLYDKLIEQGEKFENDFVEEIITLTQKLFEENIINKKFGKNIPILIHELEYYDRPINWTKKANEPELINEFISAYQNGKI